MTELLAPAGSVEALHSAINAGCDAVYIGGKMFGARAYADNPDRDDLLRAIDHCHIFDKKIYLTVNTLLKNDELKENLYNFLRPYYEEGLDGVIVSDPGVMKAISLLFPGLPIHISTQASVTSAEGAEIVSKICDGITRVVPARELSIEEIELFKRNTDLEVEVFVHGAMCVSYSGQCLMSSIAGGRSGNRGRCAQPCRKEYDTGINNSFILSCKDMCTIPAVGRLVRAGIDSFKIEGRMKSPIYVAATVATYRKYIDIAEEQGARYEEYLEKHIKEYENDIETLREIYNRGGFCTGFLLGERNLICSDKASHNGVLVGNVKSVSGREAKIVFNKKINSGDVLEIRKDDGTPLYEYTSGSDLDKGSSFAILVSKRQKANIGQRVFRVRNKSVIDEINEKYVENHIKRRIGLTFDAERFSPLRLTVKLLDNPDISEVTVCGACPEEARTASANEDNIRKHLCKTGDFEFEIIRSDIYIEKGLFIPVGALNTLRREAFEELKMKLINRFLRKLPVSYADDYIDISTGEVNIDVLSEYCDKSIKASKKVDAYERHALVTFEETLKPVLDDKSIKRIYFPIRSLNDKEKVLKTFTDLAEKLSYEGRELYVALPYICRENTFKTFIESGIIGALSDRCGFLVRNNEELALLKYADLNRIVLDHTMHIFNRLTADAYGKEFIYSPELNKEELAGFGKKGSGELIVYGRLPLMQTAHCVYKNEGCECIAGRNKGIIKENYLSLKDSKGYVFPVIRRCEYCTNIIFNSSILDLRDLKNDIEEISPSSVRYDFTTESPATVKRVLDGGREEDCEYTYGHFKRGVL
ncbi:MAG: U32 family peptidase [Lachnospiraceae bacterium]|nr:U32 family peptidase [Lachnospiraceae bacterium]